MSEKTNDGAGASINPDEVVDIKLEDIQDESAPPEKVKVLKTGIKTLSAQKKHWRDEAVDPATGKKYKDILAERDKSIIKPITPEANGGNDQIVKRVASLEQVEEKRQFGHEHNLSPEETDRVFTFAQGAGKKPAEVLTDPFVKSGLASLRAANKTSSATPRPSSRQPVVEGKTWDKLDESERRANWPKMTGAK